MAHNLFRKPKKASDYCVVCLNNSKKNPEFSYFRFPKDENRCNEWKLKLQLERLESITAEECYKRFRVCSAHFQEKMFSSMQKNQLKRDAVPSKLQALEPVGNCEDSCEYETSETEEESTSQEVDLFNQEETVRLIEAYKKHENLFNVLTSNAPVWNLISSELDCEDIQKNPKECETKWKSLVKAYRTHIKDKDGSSEFVFANEMEAVLKNDKELMKRDKEVSDIKVKNEGNTSEIEIIHMDDNFWSFVETSALVEAYGQHKKSFTKDGDKLRAWGQISSDLITKNIHRSPESCKRKWESLIKKHRDDQTEYEFHNEIDNVGNEQVEENVDENVEENPKRHKGNCECFERRIVEKQKRHKDRMDMMKRKMDIEERKLAAFEKYLAQSVTEKKM